MKTGTDDAVDGEIASPLPAHLDLDLSSKCNLRCTFCHLSYFDVKEATQLSFSEFQKHIAPILPSLRSLTLFSKYEPLVCRDFVRIFEAIAQYDIETYFSTNGILFTEESLSAITGRLRWLTVSVTGFSRADYARHMGSDKLDAVTANLRRLNELKRERGTPFPRLRLSTVGMRDTLEDLPKAIDFAREHDAEEGVQVTSLIAYDAEMVEQLPLHNIDHFERLTEAAVRYAEERGVRLVLQSGSLTANSRETADMGHRPCHLPWRRLSVQPNGDVYPCPVAYQPVGSLTGESLLDIWNGERLARFRAGVNDLERMNEDCRNCNHCRHKSVVRPEANDHSQSDRYVGGMARKRS